MTETLHPARSADFLSRLYDGELSAADREAFAAHQSGCEECRSAAEAYAATLAAFRASPTAAPAADLSARILRKIRAQSPSRRPFGVMFGIDVRWAGVFAAALIVVLISTPLVLQRQKALTAPSSIPVRILDATAEAKPGAPQAKASARRDAAPRAPEAAPAPSLLAKDEAPAANVAAAPPKPAVAEGPADEEKRRYAPPPAPARALRQQLAAEPSGGEASTSAASPSSALESAEAPLRLTVQAFDGQGAAPAILAHPPDARLVDLRGQEFVLTVEAQGRVRAVQPSTNNGLMAPMKARPSGGDATAGPGEALRELRFAPGDRPRRLLVRVQ